MELMCMTDREKFIRLLIKCGVWGADKTTGEIADHLIANGVTFLPDTNVGNMWISVEDDLPKQGEKVLVKTKTGGKFVIGYNHIFNRWSCAGSITVTHWMHLPD